MGGVGRNEFLVHDVNTQDYICAPRRWSKIEVVYQIIETVYIERKVVRFSVSRNAWTLRRYMNQHRFVTRIKRHIRQHDAANQI